MPKGPRLNHLVLNVRDIEASHRFYTEALGFEQCGDLTYAYTMRFYRGDASSHHDFALVQVISPEGQPAPAPWSMDPNAAGVNHIAIEYPDRESWLARLRHLKELGVAFHMRGNHGMTHSAYVSDPDGNGIEVLYTLPAEVWEGDVDAALNYYEFLPLDGDESLEDKVEYPVFGHGAPAPEGVPGRVAVRIEH